MGDAAAEGGTLAWLTIGGNGSAENPGAKLVVQNGSTLTHGFSAVLGDEPGEFGTATVSGASSAWTNPGDLNVGGLGRGTLTISDGSLVRVGDFTWSSDPGEVLIVSKSMSTGSSGGQLFVRNGSTLTSSGAAVIGKLGGQEQPP